MKDDMNMDHGSMDMNHSDDHMQMNHDDHHKMNHDQMDHGDMHMDHSKMDHSKMDHMDGMKMDGHDMGDMHGHDMGSMQGHDMGNMSGMDMSHGGMHMSMMGGAGMMHMDMGGMRKRFWWSLGLMILIIIFAPFMGIDLPFTFTFPGSEWVVAVLATIEYIVGTKPFFTGAADELKAKKPAMMSLISMGLIVTYWYSIYAVLSNAILKTQIMDYFWEFSTLVVIMLLGHLIEMNATMRAGDATAELRKLLPDTAHVQEGDHFVDMPVAHLQNKMVVQVQAGESFPADGIVKTGESPVNESLMTGESKPINKKAGDKIIGGTINGNGTLTVELTKVGSDSFLGQLQDTLMQSQSSKSAAETIATKVASWLFWVALIFATAALIIWIPINGVSYAVNIAVTTLVIACPHALGLAIPMVIQRTKAIAAKDGILIKNHKDVMMAKHVHYALMDKTGTLTNGNFAVQEFKAADDQDENQVLAIMATLEAQSSHPLAKAIVAYAQNQKAPDLKADNVQTIAGYGLHGNVQGTRYSLVSARYLDENKIPYTALDSDGTVSYLTDGHKVLATVALGDSLKDSAKAFIADLKADNIVPVIVTGDSQATAEHIAKELGISEVHFQVSPQDKINLVKEYQKKGQVMMIGDGINDAPALAQANLSVAIGAGTQVAQASADAVLISKSLRRVSDLIRLARNASRKQVENLLWGAGYNVIAIPMAAGVFAFAGITLNPMIGAIVMSLSTVIVAANAFLLHK